MIGGKQVMQVTGAVLDLKMRKIGLQPVGQSLCLVAAHRRCAQGMPADIRPAKRIVVDQNDPPNTCLRQRECDRSADRPTPNQDHGSRKQAHSPRVAISAMNPIRIRTLHRSPDDGTTSEEATEKDRLGRLAATETFLRNDTSASWLTVNIALLGHHRSLGHAPAKS
jgi:hypothetical protein